ncbi:alpha/beta fold hydrolase [Sphingomonas sp. So64.6b]|uniref:alpha/beta hydrolase family protein n=1 Tax=Sphingomonas sp. So64.6b TaxID=2997354 RepID=UPI00160086F3|nr:alpha/beta hydrolase [Sphingomonas sp. So64.6b]QNA86364.1 alpha/beta fold hydrolase [Sphingomonas sp. So64.6b]
MTAIRWRRERCSSGFALRHNEDRAIGSAIILVFRQDELTGKYEAVRSTLFIIGVALATVGPGARGQQAPQVGCEAAYYRLSDGSGIDIAPSTAGHFRWRRPDGTTGLLSSRGNGVWDSSTGWTERPDGKTVDLSHCANGSIKFNGDHGTRLPFTVASSSFSSDGVQLAGRLILPSGSAHVPVVVLVHGSEDSSALETYALQRMLPAQGVGVFVYDKRGTGKSAGAFTHDIRQLARDAKRALAAAKELAGRRGARFGYYGTSQGGWTAPLAATQTRVDFVIIGYGLAVSPMQEDAEALEQDMIRHGFGQAEIVKAKEVGSAAQAIVRARFREGYESLRAVVGKYEKEPWFPYLHGNVTGFIIKTPEAELRQQGPRLLAGIIPDYDPMPVLTSLRTPQLWILGGEDLEAPLRETYRRLTMLKRSGRPISIKVYPHVEHGLYEFEVRGDKRLSTRQPASLQPLIVAFAKGQKARTIDD